MFAQADEKAGEKGDKGGGGADGAQCGRARKAAHHGNIGHVEKDLQQVGQCQRQTDEQDLLGQWALGHGFGFCLTIFFSRPKIRMSAQSTRPNLESI